MSQQTIPSIRRLLTLVVALGATTFVVRLGPAQAQPAQQRPDPPFQFIIRGIGDDNMRVEWVPDAGTTVVIYSPDTCGCYITTPPGSHFYVFDGLTPGTTYCFNAYEYNSVASSDWTGWVCNTTFDFSQ